MAFEFNIEKNLFSVNDGKSDWNLELNLVSWNGRPASYDIRKWSEDHEKMSKGVTLNEEEVIKMFQEGIRVLKELTGEDLTKPVITETEGEEVPLPFG
jgi:hypothetical protein